MNSCLNELARCETVEPVGEGNEATSGVLDLCGVYFEAGKGTMDVTRPSGLDGSGKWLKA